MPSSQVSSGRALSMGSCVSMEKKINIDDLITHVMPLAKINDAFDLMHKGESIRSVVTF